MAVWRKSVCRKLWVTLCWVRQKHTIDERRTPRTVLWWRRLSVFLSYDGNVFGSLFEEVRQRASDSCCRGNLWNVWKDFISIQRGDPSSPQTVGRTDARHETSEHRCVKLRFSRLGNENLDQKCLYILIQVTQLDSRIVITRSGRKEDNTAWQVIILDTGILANKLTYLH